MVGSTVSGTLVASWAPCSVGWPHGVETSHGCVPAKVIVGLYFGNLNADFVLYLFNTPNCLLIKYCCVMDRMLLVNQ